MPVKYECPKCEKRFVEWGAEKLNFKCPNCEEEPLVRVGALDDRPVRKPTLRKRAKVEKTRDAKSVSAPVDGADDDDVVDEPEEEEVVIGLGADLLVKDEDDFDDDVVADDDDGEVSDDGETPSAEFGEDEGMGHIDIDEKL